MDLHVLPELETILDQLAEDVFEAWESDNIPPSV